MNSVFMMLTGSSYKNLARLLLGLANFCDIGTRGDAESCQDTGATAAGEFSLADFTVQWPPRQRLTDRIIKRDSLCEQQQKLAGWVSVSQQENRNILFFLLDNVQYTSIECFLAKQQRWCTSVPVHFASSEFGLAGIFLPTPQEEQE